MEFCLPVPSVVMPAQAFLCGPLRDLFWMLGTSEVWGCKGERSRGIRGKRSIVSKGVGRGGLEGWEWRKRSEGHSRWSGQMLKDGLW